MTSFKAKAPDMNLGSWQTGYNALIQIIESYIHKNICTAQPMQVVSYSNGCVSLKPVLKLKTLNGDVLPITDDDILYNVPVIKLKANGWSMDFSCSEGDFGLLIATQYDISNYKANGEHKVDEVYSLRSYSYSDGFFLPLDFNTSNEAGLKISKGSTSLQFTENSATLTATTVNVSATTVNIEADSVNLGGEGGQPVARVGDSVDINTGKITTGSSKVKAS